MLSEQSSVDCNTAEMAGTPSLLVDIFGSLTPIEICIAGATCRIWHSVAWRDNVWRHQCCLSGFGHLAALHSRSHLRSLRQVFVQRLIAIERMTHGPFVRPEPPHRADYLIGVELHWKSVPYTNSHDEDNEDDDDHEVLHQGKKHQPSLVYSCLQELPASKTFGSETQDLFFDQELGLPIGTPAVNFETGCFCVTAFLLRKSDNKIFALMHQVPAHEWDEDSTRARYNLSDSSTFNAIFEALVYDKVSTTGQCICHDKNCAMQAYLYSPTGLKISIGSWDEDQHQRSRTSYLISTVDALLIATEETANKGRWA